LRQVEKLTWASIDQFEINSSNAAAQTDEVLSASQTDPIALGSLQGSSPLKDKILKVSDGSFLIGFAVCPCCDRHF
jgi:hypothetical protein